MVLMNIDCLNFIFLKYKCVVLHLAVRIVWVTFSPVIFILRAARQIIKQIFLLNGFGTSNELLLAHWILNLRLLSFLIEMPPSHHSKP